MPGGVATPTIANNPVAHSYLGNGAQFALNMPFVPSAVQYWGPTAAWGWVRGLGFGEAINFSTPTQVIATGGVLDILDGSGLATTNVGTTTAVIGLLIGTNSTVNASITYRGLIYR